MAEFKTLDQIGDVQGKRVLVRVDLNVPMADGQGHRCHPHRTRLCRPSPSCPTRAPKSSFLRISAGRRGGPDPEFTLAPVAVATADIVGRPVAFIEDCIGEKAAGAIFAMKPGDIALLENTRFYEGEEKNDPAFTAELAKNGDIFVNDAFSAAHRAHCSTAGLADYLPAFAGRTMQAELEALERGLGNPARPVVAIVGGAKVSTKIDLLTNLVKKVDMLVIGGGMANTFLAARGTDVGKSLCEHDLAETAKQIMIEAASSNCALVLPVDGVVAKEFKAGAASETVDIAAVPADSMILDVGPKTVEAIEPLDRPRGDACLERPARCFRDRAIRSRDRRGGETCGQAHN